MLRLFLSLLLDSMCKQKSPAAVGFPVEGSKLAYGFFRGFAKRHKVRIFNEPVARKECPLVSVASSHYSKALGKFCFPGG